MSDRDDGLAEPTPRLLHRRIAAGDARVAVFDRVYAAPIDDVWDACTNPDRLARWYVPVRGDLRLGGRFEQAMMGSGEIVECEPPRHLRVSLGGGADEIELRLTEAGPGATALELQHATTIAEHTIGGQVFDAIFCMGGGYYPRLLALDRHLRRALPDGYDPLVMHENPAMRPAIERGSSAMAALLAATASRARD
ncbi:SRPBCC domain-containing protein [Baekduia soli]|uniref:SRPBCC domain-containing protein n=1 Tax=Baekduia soli TaxID=496014 RepID=UPI00165221AB|nr:SRPBCC domain-containing protein [Baekduia soli]